MRPVGGSLFLALCVAAMLAAEGARAQDHADGGSDDDVAHLDLEALLETDIRTQTVTAVSRREETVGEAPATVTVITREDFLRHHLRSVSDALWLVPGIYMSNGRDYAYTGVRGLSFPRDNDTRILVLLDGHTLNNPWSAQGSSLELLSLPGEAVERVEVIRGPSSSIYGSNAFFGVVNIVSRRPTDKTPHATRVAVGASTLNKYRAHASAQHRVTGGLDVSALAHAITGDGPRVVFQDMTRPRENLGTASGRVTTGTDYERGQNVGLTARYLGFSLQGRFANRWKGLPSAPGDAIFNDPYNSLTDRHGFIEARYQHELGKHTLSARGYYDSFRHRQFAHRDPTDFPPDSWVHGDPRSVSEGNDDTLGAELQAQLSLHESNRLIAGVEVQRHIISQPTYELDENGERDDTTLAGSAREGGAEIRPIEQLNTAVYLQNDWRPLDKLAVVAGLRYDHNSIFTRYDLPGGFLKALAPRVAVIYTPIEAATVKATYGEAFRNPTAFEAFFDDRASVCGNSDLRPERQRTGELSTYFRPGRGVNVSGSAYVMQVEGLLSKETIQSCYTGSGVRSRFSNGGTITVYGAEAGLNLRLDLVTAFASVSATSARQDVANRSTRPPNSPAFVGSIGAAMPVLDQRLWVSTRVRGVSSRLDWTLARSAAVPAYVRWEASVVTDKLVGGLRLSLTGALSTTARDPVTSSETIPRAIPQDTREVRADVGYAF